MSSCWAKLEVGFHEENRIILSKVQVRIAKQSVASFIKKSLIHLHCLYTALWAFWETEYQWLVGLFR